MFSNLKSAKTKCSSFSLPWQNSHVLVQQFVLPWANTKTACVFIFSLHGCSSSFSNHERQGPNHSPTMRQRTTKRQRRTPAQSVCAKRHVQLNFHEPLRMFKTHPCDPLFISLRKKIPVISRFADERQVNVGASDVEKQVKAI